MDAGVREAVGEIVVDHSVSSSVAGSVLAVTLVPTTRDSGVFDAVLDLVRDRLGSLDDETESGRVTIGVRVADDPRDGVRDRVTDTDNAKLLDDVDVGAVLTPRLRVTDSEGEVVGDVL
jgi:hypothetical protein